MHEAREFLGALFGRKPKGTKVVLWTKSDKRSHYFDEIPGAGKKAREAKTDVYVHVSLTDRDLGASSRIKAAQSVGIPGLWADIDVNGGPENKAGSAPTVEAALELAQSVLEPTLIVNSGYGLQAWWLFEDPWIFEDAHSRQAAAHMAGAWIRMLRVGAQERGFNIDATQDLARLMRVPGTVNGKGGLEAPVTGWPVPVDEQDGPRYAIEDLGRLTEKAPRPAASEPGSNVQLELNNEAAPPFDKFTVAIANDDTFRNTWEHSRRGAAADWSMSEHDLSLATQAANFGWSDQEIADTIVAHRRKYNDTSGKAQRKDYLARTIAKARSEQSKKQRAGQRDDALERLEEVADSQVDPDPDLTCAAFSEAVGYPIKEIVQDGRDPRTVRYNVVLANGETVPIGSGADLLRQDKFAEAMMAITGHVMEPVKREKWRKAVAALMRVRTVRESEDDTPGGTVIEWLRRYLSERAPRVELDVDEAAEAAHHREPFKRDGQIHVVAASFGTFVRTAMRQNVSDADLKAMLRDAGFERMTYGYRDSNKTSRTASYYAAAAGIVE